MSREKVLISVIVVLILINLAGLVFFTTGRGPRPDQKFDETVVRELGLSDAQVDEFDNLKSEHHQQIMDIDRQMIGQYQQYFNLLAVNDEKSTKDSLENILSSMYKEKIKVTYEHFEKVKAICSSEQQKKFQKLVPLLMQVINPQKNPGPPRRN